MPGNKRGTFLRSKTVEFLQEHELTRERVQRAQHKSTNENVHV